MPPVPANPVTTQQNAYDTLKSAVLGSNLNSPEVAGLYSSAGKANLSQLANAGGNYNTGVTVANQQAQEKAIAQAQKDFSDPSKYQQIPKADGGYTFVDPAGNEISAFAYSRATNKSPDSILSKSQNPIDVGFVQDYKNLQDFMNAIVNKDTKKTDAILKANPELKNYEKDLPGLIQRFQAHYPTVFGGTQNGFQPTTSTFIPNTGVAKANNSGNPLDSYVTSGG